MGKVAKKQSDGVVAPNRKERKRLRGRMKELLLLLPNMVRLLGALIRDSRVSRTDKVILGASLLYVIAPLDFLPDLIPFIGQVDDAYLVALSILRIINRADAKIVTEHWKGSIDIEQLVSSVMNVATYFLPERIRKALTAKVQLETPKRLRQVK